MYATVQELVDALTLEETAGLCTGAAVPRLGLPALRVNGLHSQESAGGVCFPSACAAAASFDPEAARRMGAALGREARSSGAQLLEVPDVNLKRGPLSGRSADTWAEDPCLTGALAAAFLQGEQSAGEQKRRRIFPNYVNRHAVEYTSVFYKHREIIFFAEIALRAFDWSVTAYFIFSGKGGEKLSLEIALGIKSRGIIKSDVYVVFAAPYKQ